MTKVTMTVNGNSVSGFMERCRLLSDFSRGGLLQTGTHLGGEPGPFRNCSPAW